MPDFANPVPMRLEETGQSPGVAPSTEAPSIPNDIIDYVTPPSQKVVVVTVRYGEPKKGTPMPYDLADADEEP